MTLDLSAQERFEQILLQTRQNLQDFLHCLEQERSVLEQQDLQQLEDMVQKKQAIIASLQTVSQQCQHVLQMSHLHFTDSSIKNFLKVFPLDKQSQLSLLWHEIKSLLSLTHQYNMRNGMIINMLKNHNDGLLKLIIKQAPPTDYADLQRATRASISTREHKA